MRRHLGSIALWLVLLAAPYWLPLIGGYPALGTRVLVLGLAAMALNLLLGYAGALSFGQAAYFGLGAYGAGLAMIHIAPSTWLGLAAGTLLGGVAAAAFGPLVVRRRGIYFAMITIAIGQMFYFIAVRWNAVTGGEDGLTGFSRQPIHLLGRTVPLGDVSFYYFVLFFLRWEPGSSPPCCTRRLAIPGSRCATIRAAPVSSASIPSAISGPVLPSPAPSRRLPGRSRPISTISPRLRTCIGRCPAIS